MTVTMDAQRAYTLLGLAFNEPLELIKKAFRKLALTKHPDKNKNDPNASETFMELQKAYDHLVSLKQDSSKKSNADKNNNSGNNQSVEQPLPNEFDLKLTLEEIFNGCVKEQTITRKIIDINTGEVTNEEKVLQIQIIPGVVTGQRITKEREGDSHVGRIPANVIFIVSEHSHVHFKRSRFNLEYTAKLTTEEACLGEVLIPTLENEKVPLKIDELITPNTVKRILERGFPHPNGNGKRGDIIVRFEIVYESDRPQDPPVEYPLQLTLEQILRGCTKNVKIKRIITDADGNETDEDKILTVEVKAGTEEGTPFRFHQKGDKRPETIPADIVFVARDKTHSIFKRDGVNIEHTIMITSVEAQNGHLSFEVPTLENDKLSLTVDEPITFETTKRFEARGLPHVDEVDKRGDLIVRFEILNDSSLEPPIEKDIGLTLENVLNGCTKRLRSTRKIFDNDGNETTEEKILTIDIKPGTEEDTRFTFPREGDKYPGRIPADIVFITFDKEHDTFTRNGANLEFVAKMTQSTFSNGGNYMIPSLGGDDFPLSLDGIVKPSTASKRIASKGLPYFNNPEKRGDLIVRFDIIEDSQAPPVKHDLYLTSEQMLKGFTKNVNITRNITDVDGNQRTKEKMLSVEIPAGTKDRFQIVFEKSGDQRPGKIPSDVVFVVREKIQAPPVEYPIEITLENILKGQAKRVKINRLILDEYNEEVNESEIVTLDIKPGAVAGTKFTFPQKGDQIDQSKIPADVVFVIDDKPHNIFQRNGVDIEYTTEIDEDDLINGIDMDIPTLEQDFVTLTVESGSDSDTVERILGRGLPHLDNPKMRGDLVVRFDVM